MKRYQVTDLSHLIISEYAAEGDICIDATMGNGHDTEFLCRLVGSEGHVYAFDIQEQAITNTRNRLKKAGCDAQASLYCVSHEKLDVYAGSIEAACVVFNLGYLPSGDHSLATRAESTIRALDKALILLKKGGAVVMCIYSGGDSGYEERDAVLSYVQQLDTKKYLVLLTQYYNRPNDPPMIATIVRL